PTGIPDKGKVLTALSNFWFELFRWEFGGGGYRDHLIQTDVGAFPAGLQAHKAQLTGRSGFGKKTRGLPIWGVVRGYITGSGWKDYQKTGVVSGVKLPAGLRQCEQLPEPIFTPSTKAEKGHDEPISFEEAAAQVGTDVMDKARRWTIDLYKRAAAYART